MYGFQSYPSNPNNLRFNTFLNFKKKKYSFGYSDHSIFGLSNELLSTFFFSIILNCTFFEKHVCLNINKKPYDYISSVHFSDFNKLIEIFRLIESLKKNLKNFFLAMKKLNIQLICIKKPL